MAVGRYYQTLINQAYRDRDVKSLRKYYEAGHLDQHTYRTMVRAIQNSAEISTAKNGNIVTRTYESNGRVCTWVKEGVKQSMYLLIG